MSCITRLVKITEKYFTCHWCHVLERESFSDGEVAGLLNRDFISIEFDREERPDIDHVYMTATQSLTGSGGWPMTVIMTPDRKLFYAGTYFPKNSRWGLVELYEATFDPKYLKDAIELNEQMLKNLFQSRSCSCKSEKGENYGYRRRSIFL